MKRYRYTHLSTDERIAAASRTIDRDEEVLGDDTDTAEQTAAEETPILTDDADAQKLTSVSDEDLVNAAAAFLDSEDSKPE